MDELVANPCDGRFERSFFHLTLCWYYLSLKWQQKLWWRVFNAHSHTPICLSISQVSNWSKLPLLLCIVYSIQSQIIHWFFPLDFSGIDLKFSWILIHVFLFLSKNALILLKANVSNSWSFKGFEQSLWKIGDCECFSMYLAHSANCFWNQNPPSRSLNDHLNGMISWLVVAVFHTFNSNFGFFPNGLKLAK